MPEKTLTDQEKEDSNKKSNMAYHQCSPFTKELEFGDAPHMKTYN